MLSQGLRWLLDPVSPFYIKPRVDLDLVRWLWWFQQACREAPMRKGIPVLRDLSNASLELYRGLADQGELEFGFGQKGWMQIFRSESLLAKALAEARLLREFGLESTLLDTVRVREMEPNVHPSIIAGIHYPDDAHLIPHRFVHQMAAAARRAGAILRTGTEVLEMQTARNPGDAGGDEPGGFPGRTGGARPPGPGLPGWLEPSGWRSPFSPPRDTA